MNTIKINSFFPSTDQPINITTMAALEWSQDTVVAQRPAVVFCVLATITHTVFWIQVYHFSSYRKTNMQWIYAYLITDQLLIVRFFSSYIIHTGFYQSASNATWGFIICLTDATVDNYLNFWPFISY